MNGSLDDLRCTGNSLMKRSYKSIVTAGLALALSTFAFHLYAAWSKEGPATVAHSQPVQALREERLATLRRIVDLIDRRYHSGSASMAELLAAQRDLAEAQLEASATQEERVQVLEKMVSDASILDDQAVQLARKNVVSEESALAIKADLLQLKIRLNQAQAESSPKRHDCQEDATVASPLKQAHEY